MPEPIHNRKALQTEIRSNQQELARKKQELAAQQKEDLASMKSYYADKNRELDSTSAASVNHIKLEAKNKSQTEDQDSASEDQSQTKQTSQRSVEKKSTYNRKAQTEPMIQNYETKESDKFYKVQDRGSRLKENSNAYIIEAYAPEHEQNNLRVSIQNNKATISGQRKHSEAAEMENKKITTNNFQTFREEFHFDRPVSHQGMTRERIGDFVRFSIPKLEAVKDPEES